MTQTIRTPSHDCSDHKLNCCHSSEAVLLLLSQFPQKFSIKEISELTNFHRNTLSSTIKTLVIKGKLRRFSGSEFCYGGVKSHYQRQAESISELTGIDRETKQKIAEEMAYNNVRKALADALQNGPEFSHRNLQEAMVHLKMAYPFTDIVMNQNGVSQINTHFRVLPRTGETTITKKDFNLRIHSCLCEGRQDLSTACAMVQGALRGAIEGSIGIKAQVELEDRGVDQELGSYCEYNIKKISRTIETPH
ncbi:MAG: hypothetical protein IH840_05860 [Candidatus Heimdallarchaeota archaeon]|nr:hypothetical protein [Candidatus Heimdallarchaeota archaeon]